MVGLWVLNCCFLYVNRLIVVYTVVCLCIVVVYYAVYCFWFGVRWCFRCVVMVFMLVMVEFVLLLVKLGFWLGV